MSDMLRYGVFHVGQTWCIAGLDRPFLGFVDRERALAAADVIVNAHRACGEDAEVIVEDEGETLRPPPL